MPSDPIEHSLDFRRVIHREESAVKGDDEIQGLLELAAVKFKSGKHEEAVKYLDQVIAKKPNDPRPWLGKCLCLLEIGQNILLGIVPKVAGVASEDIYENEKFKRTLVQMGWTTRVEKFLSKEKDSEVLKKLPPNSLGMRIFFFHLLLTQLPE